MTKIIVVGFGRMGLSHALQLNAIVGIGAQFYVVDSSLVSRVIAKSLLPDCLTFSKLSHLPSDLKFDYALLTTPPVERHIMLEYLSKRAVAVLVEKPVLCALPDNAMTGYVYQHLPIFDYFSSEDIGELKSLSVSVETNLDFRTISNWRSNQNHNQIVNEFLGHALTFLLTPIVVKGLLHQLSLKGCTKSTKNALEIECLYGDSVLKVELCGARDVRKTTISGKYSYEDGDVEVTPYSISSPNLDTINIAAQPTSVPFYLRGFEFARQAKRLVNGKGDVLSRELLNQIDNIVVEVARNG